jgi:regulator of protease activity HflC (stomatin/prohibitin superfamily)
MFDMTLFIVGFAILAMYLGTCLVITPQQSVRMIETFGKFSGIRRAGLSLKAPYPFQSASAPFSLRLQESVKEVDLKTKDNAFVMVPIRVQFMVDQSRAREAYYLLDDPVEQIKSYVINQVRSTGGGKTLNELFTSRDAFEKDVQDMLEECMGDFGYIIRNVLVDDPQPSPELREAFDRVIASERLKEAAANEAEAERIRQVAAAQAEKESMVLRGEAISEFRKTITEGNADAIKLFTEGTGLNAKDALEFITAVNEMETVGRAAEAGGTIVFSTSAKKSDQSPLLSLLDKKYASKQGKAPKKAPQGEDYP